MRANRMIAGLIAVVAAVLGLGLVTTGPATAGIVYPGQWVAYGNTNPITSSPHTWRCAGSKTIATNVLAQVCAIQSKNGNVVQGAVIVRNNRSSLFSTTAQVEMVDSFNSESKGEWACPSSGVGANSWSVCFGRSFTYPYAIYASGYAKGVYLGYTGDV